MEIQARDQQLEYIQDLIVGFFLFLLKIRWCLCVKAHELQQIFDEVRSNPAVLRHFRQVQPQLADAIERNDMSMIRFL